MRMFALGLVGLLIMIPYYITQIPSGSLLWLICVSTAGVLFAVLLGTSIYRLLKNSPAISLTNSGLIDSISLAGAGVIPWNEVKSVKYEKYLNQEQILIVVSNSEKIINSLSYFKKNMVNQQFKDTGAVIVINPKLIKTDPKDLVSKIKRRARV